MDNKNEKDFKGHSQSEGKTSKDAIPLWLQGLEDQNLEETSPIYPKNDIADNWVKEISDDPSENGVAENGNTFTSLEDDEPSDRVLPNWLSELSKVDPSLPKMMHKESVETNDKQTHQTNTQDEISFNPNKTEEIEINQIPSEMNSEPEDNSYENEFIEISDIDLRDAPEVETQEPDDNFIPEETLPYWLRDMIAEPNESASHVEENPPLEVEDQLEQNQTDEPAETVSEPQDEEILTTNPNESKEQQDHALEPLGTEEEQEIPEELPTTNEMIAEDGKEDPLAEAIDVKDSPEEAIELEESSEEAVGMGFDEQEQEITKPININEQQPSEQLQKIMPNLETDNQPNLEEDLSPEDIIKQPEPSTEIGSVAMQKQSEQVEESSLQDTRQQLDEKAEMDTIYGVQTQEETSPSAVISAQDHSDEIIDPHEKDEDEELEGKSDLSIMGKEGQQEQESIMEPDTHAEEHGSIEQEFIEPDLEVEPDVYENIQTLPPEHEIPVTLDMQDDELLSPPPAGPEMHEDYTDLEETAQVQPSNMPKTLLFAKYLLEQGDTDSATQIFGTYIEKSEHLDDIEAWLIDAANDAPRSNSKVWELIGDIAMVQDNPNHAFESYTQAIKLLLRSKKEFDETN